MNENILEGELRNGVGKVQSVAGDALDRPDMRAGGAAKQIEGKTQALIGDVQDAVAGAADRVSEAAVKVGGQARELYGQAAERAQAVASRVDPFVKEQPYAALAVAAVTGLLFGLLYAGRGPKVVYVKPKV